MKSFRGPLQLYLKLVWLQAESGTGGGDVSGNADFAPTQPEREVYDLLAGRLADARKRFDELYDKDDSRVQRVDARQRVRPADDRQGAAGAAATEKAAPEEDDDDDWAR